MNVRVGKAVTKALRNQSLQRVVCNAQRPFSTSFRLSESAQVQDSKNTSERETLEVQHISDLLRTIRDRTDPAHRNLIPVRSPILWSETLGLQLASRNSLSDPATRSSDPPPPRRMQDSYCQVDLPFASNPLLLEKYTNASGGIRTGKLMEHLDSLAGSIAYKHVLGPGQTIDRDLPKKGFYLVTASVDR
jgi:acyl-coenzyme A thioesterase 9